MVTLLHLETSTEKTTLALSVGDRLFQQALTEKRSQINTILPLIEVLLKQASLDLADIDGVTLSGGPGSFTGIRIGMGVLQGIAVALNKKTYLISRLQVLAQTAFRERGYRVVCPILNAFMGECYYGYYAVDAQGIMQPLQSDAVMAVEHFKIREDQRFIPIGNACGTVDSDLYAHAEDLATLGKVAYTKDLYGSVESSAPFYLRTQSAWRHHEEK